MNDLSGRYPRALYATVVTCLGLFTALQLNGLGLLETIAWTLVLCLLLGILFCRAASRFVVRERRLHVHYLLAKEVTIDLSAYALEDYSLNFFSMDSKSQFYFTGMQDNLLFTNADTGDKRSVSLNSRMHDTRKLLKVLRDSPATAVLRVSD